MSCSIIRLYSEFRFLSESDFDINKRLSFPQCFTTSGEKRVGILCRSMIRNVRKEARVHLVLLRALDGLIEELDKHSKSFHIQHM